MINLLTRDTIFFQSEKRYKKRSETRVGCVEVPTLVPHFSKLCVCTYFTRVKNVICPETRTRHGYRQYCTSGTEHVFHFATKFHYTRVHEMYLLIFVSNGRN